MISEGLLLSALFGANAAESITHRICKPSANTVRKAVGYDNETTRAGYNYCIPPFRSVGGDKNATDIQLFQLPADFDSGEASFQFLTAQRRSAATYSWVMPEDAYYYKPGWPEGLGLWVDEDEKFPEEPVTMKPGEAVQLDMGENTGIKVSVFAPIEL